MKRIYFLIIFLSVALLGCRPEETACDVKSVLLEESSFPGKVTSEPIDSPIPEAPPESAERIFYISTDISVDGVQQDIMNFKSVSKASNFFENREKQMFETGRGTWELPQSLTNLNLASDQSYLACGVVFSGKTCRWLSRYKGYYVYLRSDISDTGMTVNDFAKAVSKINELMIACIGK